MMKLIHAAIAAVAALAAVPAQAAITLTGAPAAGVDLNTIRVGQNVTFNYSISGLPGERLTGGGTVNVNYGGALGNPAIRFASTLFDDASTNPIVFFFDFTAVGTGPAFVTGSLIDVATTSGTQTTVAPTISFNVLPAVPEPASWAMMIGGMGLVGGALRRRERQRAVLAA